jgi:hypothetical protein
VASILMALIIGPKFSSVIQGLWRKRADSWSAHAAELQGELRGHLWPAVATVAMFVVCTLGGRVGARAILNADFDSARFPVHAVDEIAADHSQEPILCPDSWGGYLIFRLWPGTKVVVDDRHDLFGQAVLQKYLTAVRVEPGWNQVLEEWNVRRVLMPNGSALANILRETPEWRVAYDDSTAVLLVRTQRQVNP